MPAPQRYILLVEDNPDDEELTLISLRKFNLANDIVIARDGIEAIEYLHGAQGGPGAPSLPAVVMLDLKLPRLDGLGVLRRIRAEERTRTLPVVVLTSSSLDTDIIESYNLGANSYVRKPVEFNDFVEATSQLGLYWMVLNSLPALA